MKKLFGVVLIALLLIGCKKELVVPDTVKFEIMWTSDYVGGVNLFQGYCVEGGCKLYFIESKEQPLIMGKNKHIVFDLPNVDTTYFATVAFIYGYEPIEFKVHGKKIPALLIKTETDRVTYKFRHKTISWYE